jgi:flagellar basal body-associated protein FliL
MKNILLIISAVLMALAIIAGVVLYLVLKPDPPPVPSAYQLPEVTTDLVDRGMIRFIVTFKLESSDIGREFDKAENKAAVMDTVLAIARNSKRSELMGSAGMQQMGTEIKEQVESRLGLTDKILEVNFTEFVVN